MGTCVSQCFPDDDVVLVRGYGVEKVDLHAWVQEEFSAADGLIFVGATGIAVRSIAAYVQKKTCDPAVLVMDEAGRFVIPLLSGHVGGANRMARRIAEVLESEVVLTTATDVRGRWAVDEWAVGAGMALSNPAYIKQVSARLLREETIFVYSDVRLEGTWPAGVALTDDEQAAHVIVSPRQKVKKNALHVVPRCIVAGVGCRKNTAADAIEIAVQAAFYEARLHPLSLAQVASVDLKLHEAGLVAFCETRAVPFFVYSAEELGAVEGSCSASEFVKRVVGVDNVCERSALMAGDNLVLPKYVKEGVTVALAKRDISYQMETEK